MSTTNRRENKFFVRKMKFNHKITHNHNYEKCQVKINIGMGGSPMIYDILSFRVLCWIAPCNIAKKLLDDKMS